MEARLASGLASLVTPSYSLGDRWVLTTAHHDTLVLVVTSACTTSLLVAPLFLVGAGALLLRRLEVRWTFAALAVGVVVLLGLGTLRMGIIGLSWTRWGTGATWFTHDVLGTLISVVSAAAALGVMLLVITRRSRVEARTFPDSPSLGSRGEAAPR